MSINLIVAINNQTFNDGYPIGATDDNGNPTLPWDRTAPAVIEDLERFKALTTGNMVVMGRVTKEALGRPLKGRVNVVISSGAVSSDNESDFLEFEGVYSFKNSELFKTCDTDIFIIGGVGLYEAFIGCADNIYITVFNFDSLKYEPNAFLPQKLFNEIFLGEGGMKWQAVASESFGGEDQPDAMFYKLSRRPN